jgi:hypothetical protein
MMQLIPNQAPADKPPKRNLSKPEERFFSNVFTKHDYAKYLETNASTDEGIKYVAKSHALGRERRGYLLKHLIEDHCTTKYYKLYF